MKIINYKYGYLFDCSIHGKIQVSQDEWRQIRVLLFSKSKWCGHLGVKFARNMLASDMVRSMQVKGAKWYNIRVSATEAVVKHFMLTKYKKGNYVFEVKDEPCDLCYRGNCPHECHAGEGHNHNHDRAADIR